MDQLRGFQSFLVCKSLIFPLTQLISHCGIFWCACSLRATYTRTTVGELAFLVSFVEKLTRVGLGYVFGVLQYGKLDKMKQINSDTRSPIEEGSTNVYADLGYADAAAMQRKSQLAAEIASTIEANGWAQEEASKLLGIDQSKLSRVTRGQFREECEAQLRELVAKLGKV